VDFGRDCRVGWRGPVMPLSKLSNPNYPPVKPEPG
jgi:hypothetical protein